MNVDDNSIQVLGALFILFCLGVGAERAANEGWEKIKEARWPLLFFVAMVVLLFWTIGPPLLALYGIIALATAGYYVGRAIINQAHADIRPDDSDSRRRVYTAVQIVVFVGIVWVVGEVAGVDWRDVLESDR